MRNTLETIPVHRNHKARMFEMIFRDKKRLLELYNAVNGTHYTNPDVMELKLSDAFMIPEAEPALELRAVMLNINKGRNEKLMQACKTLRDYAEYTYRVRTYAQTTDTESAVRRAIKECIEEDVLSEFLRKNQAEAISMSIYEYDEKRHMQMERDDAREEGREEERVNTERERKRAEEAEAKVRELEKKLAELEGKR